MVTLLLRHGTSPNRSDEVGRSALELAVTRGDDEVVKLLLHYGARIRVCSAGNCFDAAAEARARGDSQLTSYIEAVARTRTE
jgi:ankyrin repeat protein